MSLRSLLFIDSLAIFRLPPVCAVKKTSTVQRTGKPWSRLHNTDVIMARHQEAYRNWDKRKPYNRPSEAQCFTICSMKSRHCTALLTVMLGVIRTPKEAAWHSAAHVQKKPLYNFYARACEPVCTRYRQAKLTMHVETYTDVCLFLQLQIMLFVLFLFLEDCYCFDVTCWHMLLSW